MTDTTNEHLMGMLREMRTEHRRDMTDLRKDLAEVKRRTDAIEKARAEARSTYDQNWDDVKGAVSDVRVRLERIEFQTTRTNGRLTLLEATVAELGKLVAELREWKSYMSGVAASFSWWKPALAAILAGGVLWLVAR